MTPVERAALVADLEEGLLSGVPPSRLMVALSAKHGISERSTWEWYGRIWKRWEAGQEELIRQERLRLVRHLRRIAALHTQGNPAAAVSADALLARIVGLVEGGTIYIDKALVTIRGSQARGEASLPEDVRRFTEVVARLRAMDPDERRRQFLAARPSGNGGEPAKPESDDGNGSEPAP